MDGIGGIAWLSFEREGTQLCEANGIVLGRPLLIGQLPAGHHESCDQSSVELGWATSWESVITGNGLDDKPGP